MARRPRTEVETDRFQPIGSMASGDNRSAAGKSNDRTRTAISKEPSEAILIEDPDDTPSPTMWRGKMPVCADDMSTACWVAAFESAVRDSTAFSWMGVILRSERLQRPMLDVYLSERTLTHTEVAIRERVADVVDIFDDLALSLEPHIAASLHLVKESDLPALELQEEIIKLCTTSPTHSLQWQEPL